MGKEERKKKNWLVGNERELAVKFPKRQLTRLDVARRLEQPF